MMIQARQSDRVAGSPVELLQGVPTLPTRDPGSAGSGCHYPVRAPHSGLRVPLPCGLPLVLGKAKRRETVISNLHCLAAYPFTGKASGVNPEEKSTVGASKAVRRCLQHCSAAPAT